MANIRTIAREIKMTPSITDLEFLASLFDDSRITDAGSGSYLQRRLLNIFQASGDGMNNGVTHFGGIFSGCKDSGFREAFKDPWRALSDNQVGHFMTAVDMGFRPGQTYSIVPGPIRAAISPPGDIATLFQEVICLFLIIGHEQVPDDGILPNLRAPYSPTSDEISKFYRASDFVDSSLSQELSITRSLLRDISIGKGVGNSFQDLHLSLFGFKFGKMIRNQMITDKNNAAMWIRTNIGNVVPFQAPDGAAIA